MTAVVIAPRMENVDSDTESVLTGYFFRVRPSVTYTAGGQWVTDEWPPMKNLSGSAVTIQLDAHATVPYELEVYRGSSTSSTKREPIIHEYRIVTSSGSPLNWHDLTLVTGPTGGAVPTDTQAAINTALWAAIGAVSGGASTLAGISDMSAFMRTVNDDTSAGAARTTLGAAADADVVHDTGDETVAGVKTFSSSPIVPTPTTSGQAAPKSYIDAAIATVPTVPAGLKVQMVYKQSDPNAARPSVASNVAIVWDLGPDATTPPVNMGVDDYWLS